VSLTEEQLFFIAQEAFCYEHSYFQNDKKESLLFLNCLTKLIIQLISYFSLYLHLLKICDLIKQIAVLYEH